jgi:hypothetical protein
MPIQMIVFSSRQYDRDVFIEANAALVIPCISRNHNLTRKRQFWPTGAQWYARS